MSEHGYIPRNLGMDTAIWISSNYHVTQCIMLDLIFSNYLKISHSSLACKQYKNRWWVGLAPDLERTRQCWGASLGGFLQEWQRGQGRIWMGEQQRFGSEVSRQGTSSNGSRGQEDAGHEWGRPGGAGGTHTPLSHLSRPAASQLQSFIANMPVFQISRVSREVWIVLKGNMEEQTNRQHRLGQTGPEKGRLAYGPAACHSGLWSERENFWTWAHAPRIDGH